MLSTLRPEICSSIFRNVKREGMYVQKETSDEHFKAIARVNGKTNGIGRGRFVKKIKDSHYAESL